MTMVLRLLLPLLSLLVAGCMDLSRPASQGPLVLPTDAGRIDLAPWVDVLALAPTGTDDALQPITAPDLSDRMPWHRLSGPIQFGASKQSYWLRLQIQNPGSAQTLNLELHRATLEHLTLLSRDANGHWLQRNDGTQSLHHQPGPIGFLFPLYLPHGDSVHYLRISSTFPILTNLILSTPLETLHFAQNSAGWFGAMLGLLGALGLLPVLLAPRQWAMTKLAQAGLYLSIIFYALCDRGTIGNWWLSFPGAQHAFEQLGVMLINLSTTAFVAAILHFRRQLNSRRMRLLLALLLLQAANLMQGIVAPTYASNLSMLAISLLTSGMLVLLCWHASHQDKTDQRLLTWALGALVTRCAMSDFWPGWLPLYIEPYQLMLAWALLSAPLTHGLSHRRASLPQQHHAPRTDLAQRSDRRTPPRVLVVEDNPWVQQVLTGFLGRLACTAHSVHDGESALAWLSSQTQAPDLIFMDCDLPGMDGLSTTRRWRQEEQARQLPAIPVIGVTAYVTAFQHERMLAAGMNECLDKPVSMSRLAEVLGRWLTPSPQGST